MDFIVEGLIEAIRLIASADSDVLAAAVRSVFFSGSAVLVALLLGLPTSFILFCNRESKLARTVHAMFRVGMAFPTVFVGVVCYAVFARQGPLGSLGLLYTPGAVISGELVLALPLVVCISQTAFRALDDRMLETARTLGANRLFQFRTTISESREGVITAALTAFARCVTELGIAMIVGGNLRGKTRTLATATSLETGAGEFARGVAMGTILLLLAGGTMLATAWGANRTTLKDL